MHCLNIFLSCHGHSGWAGLSFFRSFLALTLTLNTSLSCFGNCNYTLYGTLMSFQTDANTHAPDSPRSSQSPPPSGSQGDLELELHGLANALYNLGTTVINDSTKERDKPAGAKQVGLRAYVATSFRLVPFTSHVHVSNEVVHHLTTIDDMAQNIRTMIPFQVLQDIDNSRNPMQLTKERLERAATENQFMNGKLAAIDVGCFAELARDPYPRFLLVLSPAVE